MVSRTESKHEKLLTKVELELMMIVWALEDATVRDVQERLPRERQLAYTTVATMMKILEEKKILGSVKTDRTHIYRARLSKEEYETKTLRQLSEGLFRGNPTSMVMRLLNESELNADELKEIKKLLDERLKSV